MENDKKDSNSAQKKLLAGSSDIKTFAIKTGIVVFLILIVASSVLPDSAELKKLDTPKARLAWLSFIQNPRALLRISEIEESEGKIDNALRETDLAIGLLEMHGADKQVVQQYSDRVKKLKAIKHDADLVSKKQ